MVGCCWDAAWSCRGLLPTSGKACPRKGSAGKKTEPTIGGEENFQALSTCIQLGVPLCLAPPSVPGPPQVAVPQVGGCLQVRHGKPHLGWPGTRTHLVVTVMSLWASGRSGTPARTCVNRARGMGRPQKVGPCSEAPLSPPQPGTLLWGQFYCPVPPGGEWGR